MGNFSRSDGYKKPKKFDFCKKKDCCVQSLKDVNIFLCNLKRAKKAVFLFKCFK